jgi:hypothetical protein
MSASLAGALGVSPAVSPPDVALGIAEVTFEPGRHTVSIPAHAARRAQALATTWPAASVRSIGPGVAKTSATQGGERVPNAGAIL